MFRHVRFSEVVLELAIQVSALSWFSHDPVPTTGSFVPKRIPPESPHQQSGRRQHEQVHDAEEQRRRDLRNDVRPAHPDPVDRSQVTGDRGTRQNQKQAWHKKDYRTSGPRGSSVQLENRPPIFLLFPLRLGLLVEQKRPQNKVVHGRAHETRIRVLRRAYDRFAAHVERRVDDHRAAGLFFETLDQAVVRRLEERWAACFEEWGYGAPAS